MAIVLGFDPGGKGSFGWAVGEIDAKLPVRLRKTGTADHAEGAVDGVLDALRNSDTVVAAGLDSPMYWTPSGGRAADTAVRERIASLGAPSPGGTVQHPNSLRGACVVQGPICGILLRRHFQGLSLSECHPKALLWLLRIATPARLPGKITLGYLLDTRDVLAGTTSGDPTSEHERDAALGLVSAWAMRVRPPDWRDLTALDRPDLIPCAPHEPPVGYWIPALQYGTGCRLLARESDSAFANCRQTSPTLATPIAPR